jgi:hypothetical protein
MTLCIAESGLPREADVNKEGFECRIRIGTSESAIRQALRRALPSMRWEEGDSSWDKINVSGEGPGALIVVHRYEEPGPFTLSITVKTRRGTGAEKAYLALLDKVLRALRGRVWEPLKPQPVSLIKPYGRFPPAYQFECDFGIELVKHTLDEADFGYWEARRTQPLGLHLEGLIPFRLAEPAGQTSKKRTAPIVWSQEHDFVRIIGERPSYRIEVGRRQHESDPIPRCDQLHETVQNTLLPAIGARNVRAAD